MHTTNYTNTFISVADDCPVISAEAPPKKQDVPTIARMQFEMISQNPYKFTSDDIIFHCFVLKQGIGKADLEKTRDDFFCKGQACLRSSPLGKRYGWGVHSDDKGRIALYAVESTEYKKLATDKSLKQLKAMRSKKL